MYKVAGDNVFGQWFSKEHVLRTFQTLSYKDENENFDLDRAKIMHLNWSYNLYQIDNKFYLSGSWRGREKQIVKINLPENIEPQQKIIVVGNDYNLILVNTQTCAIWVVSLETEEVKKINLNIERPVTDTKKIRKDDGILKVVARNHACLYLTVEGAVYSGSLPSCLDISHCIGKVCDIQCGYEHYILLTDVGRVYTWGNGRRLQLGHGNLTNIETPTEVEALAGIKIIKIKAGGWHSLALSEYGDLYVWGWNDTGQLGVKEMNISEKEDPNGLPKLVDFCDETGNSLNVKDVAAGSRHSAVLLEDNSVWTTGYNKYGQLGFPPDTQPKVEYFKKAFQCDTNYELICGLWCTVLVKC